MYKINSKFMLLLFTILVFLFILTIFQQNTGEKQKINFDNFNTIDNKTIQLNEASRWDENGITFIYINGNFYEMGYQQGFLLKDEIQVGMRALSNYLESQGIKSTEVENLWKIQKEFIPQNIIDFIQGTADALEIDFIDVAINWVTEGFLYNRCAGVSAWGRATKEGKLIHMRSMEFPLNIKDPLTGIYIQENPIIVFAQPLQGYSFMYPTFAGYVIEDGINEKGISVSNIWSDNIKDVTNYGTPMGVRLFEALYRADNAQDAIDIIVTNKTYGYNFIVSDAKIPMGYVIETTASYNYVGTWDNPFESKRPFREITDVVRRTNFFLNEQTSSTQREHYNIRGFRNFIRDKFSGTRWFNLFHQFTALSNGVNSKWGEIDAEDGIYILRNMYTGSYDFIWKLLLKRNPETVWWHWSACPETGDMFISYADKDNSAQYNKIINFNFVHILEDMK